ncbi:MAG: hypothetical protein PG981_000498 [Wolbachia endosymbiont of Ctenocephalides orientis wCori]|nr:MAG: hypothetical protein PG981_000498 [Wolbachia endosymbiont of Ctenocephalides orientis wCori]
MKILNVASLLKTGVATLLLTFISSPAFSYVEYEDSGYSYNNEEVLNNFYMNFNNSAILPKINSLNAVEDMKGNGKKTI